MRSWSEQKFRSVNKPYTGLPTQIDCLATAAAPLQIHMQHSKMDDILVTDEPQSKRQKTDQDETEVDATNNERILNTEDVTMANSDTSNEPITAPEPPVTDKDVIFKDGIRIPKDSALFDDLDISVPSFDLSSDMLIKANLASLTLSLQANDSFPVRTQFLINCIPLLDNIATQILRLIGVGPYEETLSIITSEESTPQTLVYRDLVDIFEQVKRIYSEEDPFLSMGHLFNGFNDVQLDNETIKSLKVFEGPADLALRKANLATFLLSTLGSIEVGFFFLNESFLDVFCPVYVDYFKTLGVRLTEDNNNNSNPGPLSNNESDSDKKNALTYHPKFGKLLKVQAGLFLELKTQAYISALEAGDRSKEEILEDIFPSDLDEYLLKRRKSNQLSPSEQDFITRCKSRKETLLNSSEDESLSDTYDWLIFLKELFSYVSKNVGVLIWGKKNRTSYFTPLQNIINSQHPYSGLTKEELKLKLKEQQRKEELLIEAREKQEKEKPEKNKRTGGSKAKELNPQPAQGPPRIRNILRRPWSAVEENALADALKDLGPYWSRILEHYGAGGSISEALKNRTQVQLKDKARNWKMSYLKNGGVVPDYLAKVTGVIERDDKQVSARKRQRKKLEEERIRASRQLKENIGQSDEKTVESTEKPMASPNETVNREEEGNVNIIDEENIDKSLLDQSQATSIEPGEKPLNDNGEESNI